MSAPHWVLSSLLLTACVAGESYVASDDPDSALASDALLPGDAVAPRLGDARRIERDGAGYNPRFLGVREPWASTTPNYTAGLDESAANIIRYPGGTFVNAWDHANDRLFPSRANGDANGWVDLPKIEGEPEYNAIANDRRPVYTIANLAKVATGVNARRVVFHMNVVTPGRDFYAATKGWTDPHPGTNCVQHPGDDWCKMLDDRYKRFKGMLERAKTAGIDVKLVELGNEYYFSHPYIEQAFPRADALGVAANYIADRVHADFGNTVQVATVASVLSGPGGVRKTNWNKDLASTLDLKRVDAVTLHAYNAFERKDTYTEASYQRALADWIDESSARFRDSDADATFLGKTKIWYTETNANWDGNVEASDDTTSGELRWAQTLADVYSAIYLYERGSAAMMLQFQFNNQVRDTAAEGHLLYNRALGLQPFMMAASGATRVTPLRFGGGGLPTLAGSDRSVVQGVCFGDAKIERCFVMNLGRSGAKLNFAKIFPGASSGQLEGYRYSLNETGVPTAISRTPALASFVLPGYAVAMIAPN